MKLRSVALIVGITLLSGACSSTKAATRTASTTVPKPTLVPSSGCTSPQPVKAGLTTSTIRSGGIPRTYLLDVPASYTGKKPYALVFGLHPLTVSYQFMPSQIGFDEMQKKYDFIGVAPSGLTVPAPFWDAAPSTPNYDVDFITTLLTHLESTLCINTAKVFSTGISNGAQLSSLLGCRLSTRITAVAPVEGEEYLTPCTGQPEPILAFHGTADKILPYAGGGLNATHIAQLYAWHGVTPPNMPAPLGIDESMKLWAAHNGCNPTPTEVRVTFDVRKRTWHGCKAPTVLYIVDGGGHGWPGKPVPAVEKLMGHDTTSIDATSLIFAFFFHPPAG